MPNKKNESTVKYAQGAQYNSLQNFLSFSKKSSNTPSYNNLFSVYIQPPVVLMKTAPEGFAAGGKTEKLNSGKGELRDATNLYAKDVNLPSKQMGTGTVNDVGSAYKYATNPTYSQFSINFMMPSNQIIRTFFERWMERMSTDSSNMCDYYLNYVGFRVLIYKWERWGGVIAGKNPNKYQKGDKVPRLHKLTAAWEIMNAFPYNIGSTQLMNEQAQVMTMNVGFYYERYRFHPEAEFDDRTGNDKQAKPTTKNGKVTPSTLQNVKLTQNFIDSNGALMFPSNDFA